MLNRFRFTLIAAIISFLVTDTGLAQGPSVNPAKPSSESQIRDARKGFDDAIARRDFSALSSFATPDLQETGPSLRSTGLATLQASAKSLVARRPDLDMRFESDRIEVNETWDVASEQGHWRERWIEKGSPVDLRGSYLAMWKRINGQWFLEACLFVPLVCKGEKYCDGK
jgi:ketosteroid isomerase-like protein